MKSHNLDYLSEHHSHSPSRHRMHARPAAAKRFSLRLRTALWLAGYVDNSPARLAREFNVRNPAHRITIYLARKWLLGEAIPAPEKMWALSQWLGVSVKWLGDDEGAEAEEFGAALSPMVHADVDVDLIADLQRLDKSSRFVAHEVIRALLRICHEEAQRRHADHFRAV